MKNAEYTKTYIEAIIISFTDGFKIYHDAKMIRLKDRQSNLLVMIDYMPTVGEIDGTVEIVLEHESVKLENVRGFYIIKNNVFKLLLREEQIVG
ncbi:MAG: hypothetical protein MJ131_09020 [Lachnospiraceae bacterium]|nr:hypothetical protein [Lachnospiraceae bacterium]